MDTLEKPDTAALMKAHADIINDHVARSSYRDTVLNSDGKVIENPVLRDKAIEVASLFAETEEQASTLNAVGAWTVLSMSG